ncbi:MAG TPA: DNA methyltransferase [Holophagaceae bacterium]|nr:DNA methyltransferase [Holophagaceae bacterium]
MVESSTSDLISGWNSRQYGARVSAEQQEIENRQLLSTLRGLSETDPEYWTFRHGSARAGTHGLSQYPAMMVPKMLEGLLQAVCIEKRSKSVFDPFVGSGTTMVEALRSGFDFAGQDINPLAVLLCQVKSGPFAIERLKTGQQELLSRIKSDRKRRIEVNFEGLWKWFTPTIASDLSRIRRAISGEEHKWVRRVFWVALAETVRLTSNSRTSTFKLHIRSKDDLSSREILTLDVFERVLTNIVDRLGVEAEGLRAKSLLGPGGVYRPDLEITLCDSSHSIKGPSTRKHDLLITSPPYGDNTSTVPYGQYSHLPLQWIDLKDISSSIDPEIIKTAYSIDALSLGGVRKNALDRVEGLRDCSSSLREALDNLASHPRDRSSRVASFCLDLDRSIDPILSSMKRGALMIWITGNRRVGGIAVPLDNILVELLEARGATFLHRINRRIPSKRMATRNSVSSTMREESIQILRVG